VINRRASRWATSNRIRDAERRSLSSSSFQTRLRIRRGFAGAIFRRIRLELATSGRARSSASAAERCVRRSFHCRESGSARNSERIGGAEQAVLIGGRCCAWIVPILGAQGPFARRFESLCQGRIARHLVEHEKLSRSQLTHCARIRQFRRMCHDDTTH